MASEVKTLQQDRSKAASSDRPAAPAASRPANPKMVVPSDQPLPVRNARTKARTTMAPAAQETVDDDSDFELQPDVFEALPELPETRTSGDEDGFAEATVLSLFKKLNYDPPVDDDYDGRRL